MGRQPLAAPPFCRFPRPGTGPTNVLFARKASNTSQNSHGMSGCTPERSPSNVRHVTRHSASRRTCSTTSEHTAANVRSSVPFAKRVLSTAPTLFATCTCTRVSTCSNATYASCTSRSHQSSCTTLATRRAPDPSAAPRAGRDSSDRLIYASTSAHTLRSVHTTVMSVR